MTKKKDLGLRCVNTQSKGLCRSERDPVIDDTESLGPLFFGRKVESGGLSGAGR
jgi:hypothetical protein